MIGPKRKLHLWMWSCSALCLPAVMTLAWMGRHPGPGLNQDSSPALSPENISPVEEWDFLEGALQGTLYQQQGNWTIQLKQTRTVKKPDVLLYVDYGEKSMLLGETGIRPEQSYALPEGEAPGGMTLRLYSLAHYEDVDTYTLKGESR